MAVEKANLTVQVSALCRVLDRAGSYPQITIFLRPYVCAGSRIGRNVRQNFVDSTGRETGSVWAGLLLRQPAL
jgi:hypothetical protein